MSIVWSILGLVALAVIGLILWSSRKPDQFRVTRRALIPASPEAVFAAINDFVVWQDWSPWAKRDPNAKHIFGAITAGEGASHSWDGNKEIGKGSMTLRKAEPHHRVVIDLAFEKPFKAQNVVTFTLTPLAEGTEVEWAMEGPANLMQKVMDTVMNMDKMCGRDFEAGLGNLAALLRAKAH